MLMEGMLDHTLDANRLGGTGGGVLLIDLEGVKRVSSNGVREWIRALKATPRTYLGFVRARPAVVSQFNMVNKFAAGGELLSFYAPYVCSGCQKEFELLIDVKAAHAQLAAFEAPPAKCPACGAAGTFDDLPASYFSYVAGSAVPAPPPIVDQLLGAGSNAARSSLKVEKEIQGTTTALRLSGCLDANSHLKRVSDGLEGVVLVLLEGISDFTPEGLDRLQPVLMTEGVSFLLARVPVPLAIAFAAVPARLGNGKVVSFQQRLECPRCRAGTYLEFDAATVASSGVSRESVVCDECGTMIPATLEVKALATLPLAELPDEMNNYLTRRREAPAQSRESTTQNMQFGRFQLLQRIGTGGMAEVFLARQTGSAGFAKLVVVKKILPQLAVDRTFVDMFLQEARLASRISHPNVVQIYDLGEMAGSYFISMEYVRGWDLNTLLRRATDVDAPLPLGVAAHIVASICAGLQAAHSSVDEEGKSAPIIHRDVSPHNVLVSADGVVKLADFGVAKAINSNRTPTTGIKGKLAYMAPEQFSAGPAALDCRIDIFPAGVVLYQLLTFRHPFQQETEFLTLKAVLEGAVPVPSVLRPDCPPELDAIVKRALAREPAERFRTAAEMQHELETFITKHGPARAAELAAWLGALLKKTSTTNEKLEVPATPTMSLMGNT